jgi:hypothetical protein
MIAQGHPLTLETVCRLTKVVFISPNITFLLQPMDQRMVATSKGPLPEEDLYVTKNSDP